MKFTISIDTDEDELVMRHLTDIRRSIKKYLTSIEGNTTGQDQAEEPVNYSHSNCDGSWELTIDINN